MANFSINTNVINCLQSCIPLFRVAINIHLFIYFIYLTGTKQRSRSGRPPGFITILITKFREGILSHLDHASCEAIMENKDFEDPAVFGRVKLAVTSRVLQWLQEHSDQDSVPTLQFF